MSNVIDVATVFELPDLPVIDVRSPAEYSCGHIPNAVNIPLFDDAQRAEVGTLYKQRGRNPAIAKGFEIVSRRTESMLADTRRIAPAGEMIVHCWRGGMRSEGFGWLLEQSGLRPRIIEGGYKAFRRHVRATLSQPRPIVILGGHTGAGKTVLLELLREAGEQVIDLEGLASHRGSAFGGLGQPPQPTVEQFENEFFLQWRDLDRSRRVWLEGESKAIGRVYLPDELWRQMLAAPAIFVEVPVDQRVDFLLQQYGDLSRSELAEAVQKIKKRLGGDRLRESLQALERNDLKSFARITLSYYDKAYGNALQKRPRNRVIRLPMKCAADADAISPLRAFADDLVAHSPSMRQSV